MDWKEIKDIIERFVQDKVKETGASGVVIGLSGGLDSALTMKICVEAMGKEKVHALLMPENPENDEDMDDALRYAKELGVNYKIYGIGEIAEHMGSLLGKVSKEAMGNIKARIRMNILYGYAYDRKLIVVGTSNKSELLTGYFTKFGDGGSDFMPIGDLYKTDVVELARYLGVPERFIEKKPSARLYPGQTDEDELGMDYAHLDCILKGIEKDMALENIELECSVSENEAKRIIDMVKKSAHKRRMPLIPKIGLRTVGWDWRE